MSDRRELGPYTPDRTADGCVSERDAIDEGQGAAPVIDRRRFLGAAAGIIGGAALVGRNREATAAVLQPEPDVAIATILSGSLVASIRATAPARIKLRAWPTHNPGAAVESSWFPTNRANAAEIGLSNAGWWGAQWSWQGIVQDPQGLFPPASDVVRTIPARPGPGRASKFSFAFGCCLSQGLSAPVLQVAKNAKPQFLAMIGDMGYGDVASVEQTYEGYLAMFRNVLARTDVGSVTSIAPFYGMQDDHDYGQDDAWADTVKEFAGQSYADLMPGVKWPGTNYRRWSIGEADFFLLDNRRYKDNPAGPFENGKYMSVLRSVQRSWLLQALAKSAARVKFVLAPMTLMYYWWKPERREVQDFINMNVSGPVIFLTGDKHAGAFAKFPNRIWELMASPINNRAKANTPTIEGLIWTENGTGPALSNCIGVVEVDSSVAQTVTLRLMREDGAEMHREVVPL